MRSEMAISMEHAQNRFQEVVRLLSPRSGFPERGINLESIYHGDEIELKLTTYINGLQVSESERLTESLLRMSLCSEAPMIVDIIATAIERLRSRVLAQCVNGPGPVRVVELGEQRWWCQRWWSPDHRAPKDTSKDILLKLIERFRREDDFGTDAIDIIEEMYGEEILTTGEEIE
jgi:hypothetical protein